MNFTVILPDEAPEEVMTALAEAVAAGGGTVVPAEAAPDAGLDPMAGGPMPPAPDPMAPVAAGPGAGMMPGAAMSQKGAFALRPR